MFLRWYRRKIAKQVEDKMLYMGTCPNERDIILWIISPKDYPRTNALHCGTDCCSACRNKACSQYRRKDDLNAEN